MRETHPQHPHGMTCFANPTMRSAMPAADVPPPLGASSPIGPGAGVSVLVFVPSSMSMAPPNSLADPGVCVILYTEGLRPSDSPTPSLAGTPPPRAAPVAHSRGSFASLFEQPYLAFAAATFVSWH